MPHTTLISKLMAQKKTLPNELKKDEEVFVGIPADLLTRIVDNLKK